MKVYKTGTYLFLEIPSSPSRAPEKGHQKIWYDKSLKKWFRTEPENYSTIGAMVFEFPDEALAAVINNLINEGKLPHGKP